MSEDSREVAPVRPTVSIPMPGGSVLPDWWVRAYGPDVLFRTTLDLTDPKQREMLLRSVNESGVDAKSRINTDLTMVGYTVSPASREHEGELQEWLRTVIHEADGTNVVFGAKSIVLALQFIEQLDCPAPWNPPMVRRLVADATESGGNWYRLLRVPPAKKIAK